MTMDSKPLLSIVIPTWNREYYCIYAIKNILSYPNNNFELIVQDNSEGNDIENFVKGNKDVRLVYNHDVGRMNSVLNMDKAMSLANGEYVTLIGDDDAILPNIFSIVEWANKNNFDCISPHITYNYLWPDGKSKNGSITWKNTHVEGYEIKYTNIQLKEFLNAGFLPYAQFLPRIYHGLIKKTVLNRIKAKTGHIIGGLSPDIYLAVSVSCTIDRYIVIDRPFTIAGACPRSYTAEDVKGKINIKFSSNPQFFKRGPYVWDERIPKLTTSPTIWSETAVKALEEMGKSDLIKKINQGKIFGKIIIENRKNIKYVLRSFKDTKVIQPRIAFIYNLFVPLWKKINNRFTSGKISEKRLSGLGEMDEAIQLIIDMSKNDTIQPWE